jgi:NADH:ubiquinone oxidoreductase subunit 6 (subunit J)
METGDIVFYISAILSVVSALIVVFSPNILYAGFSLLGCFAGVAGVYLSLSATFLAVAQVLVYVGGITILILFAIMLSRELSQGRQFEEEFKESKVSFTNLLISLGIVGALWSLLLWVAFEFNWGVIPKEQIQEVEISKSLGEIFLNDYILAFEFSSITLLGALVAAAVLARPSKESEPGDKS